VTPARPRAGERLQRAEALQADLDAVASARLPQLREIWSERLGEDPPALRSFKIVRYMLAYRLQQAVHGGLSAPAQRKLESIEARRAGPTTKPAPAPVRLGAGATLIREWKGVRHEVRVVQGGYVHDGQAYKSLSEVARAITGTRWNGPLFFGMRDKPKVAA
jgi:hypothetical protein